MYKKLKLPCSFTFKRCKIYPTSDDVYLKLFARCKDESCQKNIHLVTKKKPLEDEPLKLKIFIPFSKDIKHLSEHKRHLNGEKRKLVGEELQNTEGYLWKKEQVRKTVLFGENIPPHVYLTHVLRKAKQNYKDKNLVLK